MDMPSGEVQKVLFYTWAGQRIMSENKTKGPDRERFEEEMNKLLSSEDILKMEQFSQHQGNSTLQHVVNVAYCSFDIAEKMNWEIDEVALAKGAILHDYYLYSTKDMEKSDYQHGTKHPLEALNNARKIMDLTPKEENIIRSHMWPLTLFHLPKSKEAFLVCLADKYCATNEMILNRKDLAKKGDYRTGMHQEADKSDGASGEVSGIDPNQVADTVVADLNKVLGKIPVPEDAYEDAEEIGTT